MLILINGNTIGEQIQLNRMNRRNLENELNKEFGRVENLLNHLKRNKQLYLKLVVMIAILLMCCPKSVVLAMDVDQAIRKIDKFGTQILRLTQVIAYWAVLLTTSKDCVQTAMSGDKKQIAGAAIKGVMIMGIIYFLPEFFDMMKSMVESE